MIVQKISSSNLNLLNNRTKFCSDAPNPIIDRNSAPQTLDERKKETSRVYLKGALVGVMWTLLIILGDCLCEYLVNKNSTSLKTSEVKIPKEVHIPFKWIFKKIK